MRRLFVMFLVMTMCMTSVPVYAVESESAVDDTAVLAESETEEIIFEETEEAVLEETEAETEEAILEETEAETEETEVIVEETEIPNEIAVNASKPGWMSICKPYQYTSVTEYLPTGTKSFKVAGKEYFEGMVFYNWYQYQPSQVLYNLKGEYSKFSFDIGRVDGKSNASTNLYIYKDGLIDEKISISASSLSTHIEIDVTGVDSLKLYVDHDVHVYDVYYGLFNGEWTKSGVTAPEVAKDEWIKDCDPYDMSSTDLIYKENNAHVIMGGDAYSDAIRFYLWNGARPVGASFNLEKSYKTFSFSIGHVDNTTRARGILKVKLDGEVVKTVEMEPDDLPHDVTVDLTGASQMILEFSTPEALNVYDIYYAIVDAKFISNGYVRKIYMNQTAAEFTERNQQLQLEAEIRPRDAKVKKVNWSSSNTSVAKVDSNGVVTAVGNGTAKIVAEADGVIETCEVNVSGLLELPDPVTNLKASSAGKKQVRVTWDASEGAEGYLVYAQKNGKYGYVGMTSGNDKTSLLDTKALDTDYNFYWVFPYITNKDGKMETAGCTKYVWAKGVCLAVTNLKASSVKGGVKLTWTASAGADGYLVYGQVGGKAYGYVGMTKGTTYTDKKASTSVYNYYWVFPYHYDADGNMIVGGTPKYTYGRALK